jgi:hypothetical protein
MESRRIILLRESWTETGNETVNIGRTLFTALLQASLQKSNSSYEKECHARQDVEHSPRKLIAGLVPPHILNSSF